MKHILTALLACATLISCSGPRAPDMIIHGGLIYTGEEGLKTAQAVAVTGMKISGVGSEAEILALAGEDTEIVSLGGAYMYPGFTDAHAHLAGVGQRKLTFSLEGTASIVELVTRVEAELQNAAPGIPLYGRGWIETHYPEGRFPNRDDLDAVSPDNPVVLIRADGHALVANSAALALAGVDDATPDPSGGEIERDANGRATGILIDMAMGLVPVNASDSDPAVIRQRLAAGGEVYAARGWTGMHNMSVPGSHIKIIEKLSMDGEMPIRVYNALDPDVFDDLAEMGPFISPGALVETRAVKIYMDGALGSRGAALKAPYSDKPDSSGLMLRGKEETVDLLTKAVKSEVQVCIHAIGDRANKMALDWMEEALDEASPLDDPRWRIEHAQIISEDDIARFSELGVIASMQPSHAIGDLHFALARLGNDRLSGAYAWRALIDAGAVIAGGSDAPVEVGDPRIEFYAAITRKDLQGYSGEGWRPEQAVTREEALKMFTVWPAYASFHENDLGTIEVGKFADFSVFDTDFMTAPPEQILASEPVMTIVGGVVAWRSD